MYFCILVMKKYIVVILLIFTVLCPETGGAQVVDSTSRERKNVFVEAWGWFSRWRERAQTKGYEPGYVEYPREHPWQAKLIGKMALTTISMHMPFMTDKNSYFDLENTTGLSSKLSAGLYYRGWGLSYGPRLSNKSDLYLSLSSYGRAFGFDFKLDNFRRLHTSLSWVDNENKDGGTGRLPGLKGPELILLELNTYYVFNNKKFSYASALSQTTWQKKSAGSVIAGASIFASYLGFDHDFFGQIQFPTPYYADTLNVLSWNLLVGVGYAYNKVWEEGRWMLHVSLLPMLRWSYFNSVEIGPNGELSSWPTTERESFTQIRNEIYNYAEQEHFSFSAMARLAGLWNINERWVAGAVCMLSHYWGGAHDGMKLMTFDSLMMIYGGFRF